jgi:hypothetical protein
MKTWKHAIIGIIALFALAFTACKDGNDNGKTDNVKRQFTIESTFVRMENSVHIPYQGKINIKDETGSSVSLEDQGLIAKLQEVFDMLGEESKINGIIEFNFSVVLPRNVTIIVNNSEDELKVLNNNTLSCGKTYLSSSSVTSIAGMLHLRINAMQGMG